ncbi:MAG: NAD(P)/FAD-dependent oxidoreductase [Proteobacteria bacterium]|nr:NAD(P)/FAD-dependent oxidoreductase [Pseudomonadota bacterium]
MAENYDLVVIGAGTAAMVGAMRVRAAGWRVALTDFRPYGGTCALRGCDPKKMLMAGADVLDHAARMGGKGVSGDLRIDWSDLVAFKNTFTDPVPAKHEQRYQGKGIETLHGPARFTGPNTLDIGGKAVETRHVLIATGAEPIPLGIPGEEHVLTNEQFYDLQELPRRVVTIGGGYIAAEYAHLAARAGAQVTVLQRGERMLTQFEPELVEWLMEKFAEIGVDVRTRTVVEAVEKTGAGLRVHARAHGHLVSFEADMVAHAAGRRPALEALELEAGRIATDKGRLVLNDFLQSVSNPAVYVAGDAAQVGPPLTPVSSHDAKVVAANLLEGPRHRPDYRGVPSVAFTIPPIASVGLGEREARERGLKVRVKCEKASSWFTARQAAEPIYGFKVLVDEQSDLIVGAHLVGPHADEVINLFGLAIRHGLTAKQLKSTMFGYPTGASDIGYML